MSAEATFTPTRQHAATETAAQSRTALASIAAATLLVLLKLVTGILTGSLGLISAGIESSGDVVAAVMTFFAIRLGGGPADETHHHRHPRAEHLGPLRGGRVLLAGGGFILTQGVGQLRRRGDPPQGPREIL